MELLIALQPNIKEVLPQAKKLGVKGILTNASLLAESFGSGLSEVEYTQHLLDLDPELFMFTSVNRTETQNIVDTAYACCALSDRVGVKIPSTPQGMAAIRILANEDIKCIATAMFTYGQAYMAAKSGAWAISPFIHRGNDSGTDMLQQLRDTRALYDRIEKPPFILAASIRNAEEAELALKAGADGTAITYEVLCDLCSSPITEKVESGWIGQPE